MKYHVTPTSRFKKEYKRAIKRGMKIEKLHNVVELLAKDLELPESLCDHELKGNWKNHRELHIEGMAEGTSGFCFYSLTSASSFVHFATKTG